MKKLLLLALAACIPLSMAMAQPPDPADFHIWFGTSDGSIFTTGINKDIVVPCWGSTDPDPASPDSVTFMWNPLGTDDLVITARTGGLFYGNPIPQVPPDSTGWDPPGVGGWDSKSFLAPNTYAHVGWTNQGMLGFAFLTDPRQAPNFFYTTGAKVLICAYKMHTANDPLLIGTTVLAMETATNAANGAQLWGMQDGVRGVVPTMHFAEFYFSPNTPPTWVTVPADLYFSPFVPIAFDVVGTDTDDPPQDLHISIVTSEIGGGVTQAEPGTDRPHPAAFSAANPGLGTYAVTFALYDQADYAVTTLTMFVHVTVETQWIIGNGSHVPQDTADCIRAMPGTDAEVPVWLTLSGLTDNLTYDHRQCGGFVARIFADPTGVTLMGVAKEAAIDFGHEYFNWIPNDPVLGNAKFVWIADINNGVYHAPMYAPGGQVLTLTYHVAPGLPFGMYIPVDFDSTEIGDNTISDSSGYFWSRPPYLGGCIVTEDFTRYRGDPNFNCEPYEIADAVLVAQRLIYGDIVWTDDEGWGIIDPCWLNHDGNDDAQEAAADLNGNGFADIADLVQFIMIINGYIVPPKLDPTPGYAQITASGFDVLVNSSLPVGGVLVKIAHQGQVGTPVAADGFDIQSYDKDGVLTVVVYSLAGRSLPAGGATVFTVPGLNGRIVESSAADIYGRLLSIGTPPVLPTAFTVSQNYPNPFNAKSTIKFALPTESDVNISIYNIAGQLVETINAHYAAGYQSVTWDASNVASGVYFAKVVAGDNSRTLKMTLLK